MPRPLARFLLGHDVQRAAELGWAELKNGRLLTAAEDAGFEVLMSGDKTIRHEQNMGGRKIALVYLSDNHWPIIKNYIDAILKALEDLEAGEVRAVYCGTFVAKGKRGERVVRPIS